MIVRSRGLMISMKIIGLDFHDLAICRRHWKLLFACVDWPQYCVHEILNIRSKEIFPPPLAISSNRIAAQLRCVDQASG